MIRIGVVDDHQLIVEGLVKMLQTNPAIDVVFFSSDGRDLNSTIISNDLDVLLLDIEMPNIDGIDLAHKVLSINPAVKILILTMYNDFSIAKKAKEMGVRGFLHKTVKEEVLHKVIEKIFQGGTHFPLLSAYNEGEEQRGKQMVFREKIKLLSEREMEILIEIVQGLSNAQIGEKLFISARTVDTHRTNIMRKLQVSNVVSLVRIALQNGIGI